MPDQEPDVIAGRKAERLAMAARRYGGNFDVFSDDPPVAPQSDTDLIVEGPDLGIGLGYQQDRGVRHHTLGMFPGVHEACDGRLLAGRERQEAALVERL